MFTQKSASSVRQSVFAAGLFISALGIFAVQPAFSNDDLFEPLPEGYSPPAYSTPRVDIDARSGGDGAPENDLWSTNETSKPQPAASDDNPFSADNPLLDDGVMNAPTSDGETFTFDAEKPAVQPTTDDGSLFEVEPGRKADGPLILKPSQTADESAFDQMPDGGADKATRSVPTKGEMVKRTAEEKRAKEKKSTATSAAIFDLRAKQKLDAEISTEGKPHPLALAYPDHFTVVCEAGCRGKEADIVYQERQDERGPVNEPGEDFVKLPVEVSKNVVLCVGGCYHGERIPNTVADLNGWSAVPASAGDSTWMSNQTGRGGQVDTLNAPNSGAPKSDASGRWYDRIGQ